MNSDTHREMMILWKKVMVKYVNYICTTRIGYVAVETVENISKK